MGTVSFGATLALLLAAAVPAAAGDPPADPPAAVVHGKPLPRAAFHEALARRFLRGEGGEKLLEKMLMDLAARREQARRGVVVTDEEVARSVEDTRRRLAEQMARGGLRAPADALETSLKEAGSDLAEFTEETRNFLALQAMARQDLGAKGEVPLAQVEVWLRELVRKAGATADPAALKPGEAARIGEEPVPLERAGRWLVRNVRRSDRVGVVLDLAFGLWVEDRAAAGGLSLAPEEIDREIARLRKEFGRQPGIEGTGVAFEQWLRDVKGQTVEEYRNDASVRASLLARKMAATGVTDAMVRKEWEGNPGRYGETARVRRLVVHGEEKASVFGASARPMAEARAIADRALEEVKSGKAFEAVARRYSEDFPPDGPRGQPFEIAAISNTTVAPQPVTDAVFRAKEGELLGPIKAIDGWYLILVEKRTPAPAFEECAGRVRDDLVAAAVLKWKLDLRTDPEVRIAPDL